MENKKITNLDEAIADARAEEEVAKANKIKDDFSKQLREGLKDALKAKNDEKVTITLEEYVTLKQKEMDLDRILNALVDNLELNYSGERLRLGSGEDMANVLKVLYPEAYDTILAHELARKENEGE